MCNYNDLDVWSDLPPKDIMEDEELDFLDDLTFLDLEDRLEKYLDICPRCSGCGCQYCLL